MRELKMIYLVGFMGSGKSRIGEYVQKKHEVYFMDKDTYVTETQRKEIPAIFAEEGEVAFRRYETEALVSLTDVDVIATGGGIVEKEVNRSYMKEHGIVVYLQAPFHEIMNR